MCRVLIVEKETRTDNFFRSGGQDLFFTDLLNQVLETGQVVRLVGMERQISHGVFKILRIEDIRKEEAKQEGSYRRNMIYEFRAHLQYLGLDRENPGWEKLPVWQLKFCPC